MLVDDRRRVGEIRLPAAVGIHDPDVRVGLECDSRAVRGPRRIAGKRVCSMVRQAGEVGSVLVDRIDVPEGGRRRRRRPERRPRAVGGIARRTAWVARERDLPVGHFLRHACVGAESPVGHQEGHDHAGRRRDDTASFSEHGSRISPSRGRSQDVLQCGPPHALDNACNPRARSGPRSRGQVVCVAARPPAKSLLFRLCCGLSCLTPVVNVRTPEERPQPTEKPHAPSLARNSLQVRRFSRFRPVVSQA